MNQNQQDPPLQISSDDQASIRSFLSFLSLDSNDQYCQSQVQLNRDDKSKYQQERKELRIRSQINRIDKEMRKMHNPERVQKIMNKHFLFECYAQKQTDLERQLQEQEQKKAKQQQELQKLKRQLCEIKAKISGINNGKKDIHNIMAARGQYKYHGKDLMNAGVKQQPEIKKPTQSQISKHSQLNQKVAKFYQQKNAMDQDSINKLKKQLQNIQKQTLQLKQKKIELEKARDVAREQQANINTTNRIQELKYGIEKLKRYIRKNKHMIDK